jgi:hypothetical protein
VGLTDTSIFGRSLLLRWRRCVGTVNTPRTTASNNQKNTKPPIFTRTISSQTEEEPQKELPETTTAGVSIVKVEA